MRRYLLPMVFALSLVAFGLNPAPHRATDQPDSQILAVLTNNQYDIEAEGRKFLLTEANKNDFFLLGELHGDREIPALLESLWLERCGSSDTATLRLNSARGLRVNWNLRLPEKGQRFRASGQNERQLMSTHSPIPLPVSSGAVTWRRSSRSLSSANLHWRNLGDPDLNRMVELTKDGYDRSMAPRLLSLAEASKGNTDEMPNDVSLRANLRATLQIETDRLNPETKMVAQEERERLMKTQFLEHLAHSSGSGTTSKVLLRFGRNHLHRGYDARGISTLGNFIAEFAISQGKKTFNVGAFVAGGKASLLGETWNADERQDEMAFALLAERAKYSATLFDLRPIRALLHRIPREERSALVTNLIHWADSYDALICYKQVTPRNR